MSDDADAQPSAENIIQRIDRKQTVYVDEETGKLWTEEEVAKYLEEARHLRRLGKL